MENEKIISCKKASQLISESLEHPLSKQQQTLLKLHLAICTTCGYFQDQVKALQKVFCRYSQAICDTPPPPNVKLSDSCCKRIKEKMKKKS